MPDISQADRDLEQFVCAACHNLRQSLRNLRLLTEESPNPGIEEQIRDMESTLKGMVEYSVACVSESRIGPAEMESVLLQTGCGGIAHDPLPIVMGDASQLVTVLRHLIQNARKFGGTEVHVSAKQEGPEWVISVRDNGPGIDALYHEKVFIPFKRLHGHDYPGNGLGLATCKKLIERHGGQIWVESNNPESGATVFFRLTAPQS
jgi:signal transduction histidine kinase